MPPPAKVAPASETAKAAASPAPVVARKSTSVDAEEAKTDEAKAETPTTPKADDGKKKIRRDSKGFEKFDDYFSDSDKDETPKKGDKTTDEASVESMDVSGEASPARPLRGKAAKTPVVAKKSTEGQAAKDEETMENIASFLEEGDKDLPAVPGAAKAGKKATKADGKTDEEMVTMIFGEDGNETPKKAKEADKSVYDLEDDEPAAAKKSAAPLATSTPHVGKKEGDSVTKIGNNTYYYSKDEKAEEDGTEQLPESAEGSQIVVVREDGSAEDQDDYSFRENVSSEMREVSLLWKFLMIAWY